MKKLFGLFLMLMFVLQFANAQKTNELPKNKERRVIDSIEFSHKWVREKWYLLKSPKVLKIKAKNISSKNVKIKFSVDFYVNGTIRESSDTVQVCMKPGVTRSGRKNKMVFKPAELSQEEMKSESFQFEISNLEIIRMRSCKENEQN